MRAGVVALALWGLVMAGCSSEESKKSEDVKDLASGDTTPGNDVANPEIVAQETLSGDTALPPDTEPEDLNVEPEKDPGIRMRELGWVAGDMHLHTTHSDGDDSVAIVVALAEYLEDPTFLAAHPEYVGNPLDFIAITDHRTDTHISDPDFKSDKLVLIPAEEFGGPGHANVFGLQQHIPHDPDGDGSTAEDYRNGADEAHNQGGVFSPNHPFNPDILFAWDLRNHDAMEIVNAAWALMGPSLTPEKLAEWETAKGTTASIMFKKAVQYQGMGGNQQALKLYEAQLTLGQHVALVSGSDRHVLFPVGFPTTWIKAESNDVAGVMAGLKKRHTFVGRTPASAVLETTMKVGDATFEMGDKVPLGGAGTEVVIELRIGKAKGGKVMIIRGGHVETDEALLDAELGTVAFESGIESNDATLNTTLSFSPGEWFYPLVLEAVVPEGLPAEQAGEIKDLAKAASGFTEEDVSPLIEALWKYMDPQVTLTPAKCDPATWKPLHLQCMPVDNNGLATFFFPEWINRALNVQMENEAPTDWTLGAIGSAVMFVP